MIKPPIMEFKQDSHCSWCGTEFTEKVTWPRQCFRCNHPSFKNPIPIVVALIRVFDQPGSQCGWLIEQRNIPPEKGGWALPSGYVNFGETWQQAAARELKEEVGLDSKPEDYELLEIQPTQQGNMLIFCYHKTGVRVEDVKFVPNEEVSAVKFPVLPTHLSLCFPSHNQMWGKVYDSID